MENNIRESNLIMDSKGTSSIQALPTLTGSDVCEFEVSNKFSLLSYVRRKVSAFALEMPFSEDDIADIRLAVGEAATNAMKHGCKMTSGSIRIKMEKHPDFLTIQVCNTCASSDFKDWVSIRNGELQDHGRGILCMKAVMDNVVFHSDDTGTWVELTKKLSKETLPL